MRRIFYRRRRTARRRIAIATLAIVSVLFGIGLAGTVHSRFDSHVQIIDAGTLRLDGTLVRLFGVDAPGKEQTCRDAAGAAYTCGQRAIAFLRMLVHGKMVNCTTGYSDTTAICYADAKDLGQALVRAGWAVRAPGTHLYRADEQAARRAGRGMWAGAFEQPSQWRRRETVAESNGNSS